jgi:hypothetical protein
MNVIRFDMLALGCALLAGCATPSTRSVDRFDGVKIEQMVANDVTGRVFGRTVVCLNARREIRHDGSTAHFLYTETTPTPDFALATGESLVLLVDGVRYGMTATNSQTLFVTRPGFTGTLYPASAQLFVDLANAREVELRIKGATGAIEKKVSRAALRRFRDYLLQYYAQPPVPPAAPVPQRTPPPTAKS